MTLTMEESDEAATPVPDGTDFSQSRHAEKDEITTISANVCRKVSFGESFTFEPDKKS